jgi:hypothetical protein
MPTPIDVTIAGLPPASTPLTGTELVPLWQGGGTKQTTLNLTAKTLFDTYTYATLPAASSVAIGTTAYTTDRGPVTSNSTGWEITPYVTPFDYGAKGDWNGTTGTDDTAAFTAMFADLATNPVKTVLLAGGRFAVSSFSNLYVPAGTIMLQGEVVATGSPAVSYWYLSSNVIVDSVILTGINLRTAQTGTISNLTITNNIFSGFGGFYSYPQAQATGLYIANNTNVSPVTGVGAPFLQFDSLFNSVVTGNVSTKISGTSEGYAICLAAGNNNVISNNTVTGGLAGIIILNSRTSYYSAVGTMPTVTNNLFIGNNVTNAAEEGLSIDTRGNSATEGQAFYQTTVSSTTTTILTIASALPGAQSPVGLIVIFNSGALAGKSYTVTAVNGGRTQLTLGNGYAGGCAASDSAVLAVDIRGNKIINNTVTNSGTDNIVIYGAMLNTLVEGNTTRGDTVNLTAIATQPSDCTGTGITVTGVNTALAESGSAALIPHNVTVANNFHIGGLAIKAVQYLYSVSSAPSYGLKVVNNSTGAGIVRLDKCNNYTFKGNDTPTANVYFTNSGGWEDIDYSPLVGASSTFATLPAVSSTFPVKPGTTVWTTDKNLAVSDGTNWTPTMPFLSPFQYGAKGDWNGTTGTNDDAAFTAMFTAVTTTGIRDINLSGGRFKLSNLSNFILPSGGIRFWGGELVCPSSASYWFIQSYTQFNSVILDGISILSYQYSTVLDVEIRNCIFRRLSTIYTYPQSQSSGWKIIGNRQETSQGGGYIFMTFQYISNSTIMNNVYLRTGVYSGRAILLNAGSNNVIKNNYFTGGINGIYVVPDLDTTLGYYATTSTNPVISNNTIENNYVSGAFEQGIFLSALPSSATGGAFWKSTVASTTSSVLTISVAYPAGSPARSAVGLIVTFASGALAGKSYSITAVDATRTQLTLADGYAGGCAASDVINISVDFRNNKVIYNNVSNSGTNNIVLYGAGIGTLIHGNTTSSNTSTYTATPLVNSLGVGVVVMAANNAVCPDGTSLANLYPFDVTITDNIHVGALQLIVAQFNISTSDNTSTQPLLGTKIIGNTGGGLVRLDALNNVIFENNDTPLANVNFANFYTGWKKITHSVVAIPAAGTHAIGERAVNAAGTIGQPKAWTCTTAGTSGTWTSEGNL